MQGLVVPSVSTPSSKKAIFQYPLPNGLLSTIPPLSGSWYPLPPPSKRSYFIPFRTACHTHTPLPAELASPAPPPKPSYFSTPVRTACFPHIPSRASIPRQALRAASSKNKNKNRRKASPNQAQAAAAARNPVYPIAEALDLVKNGAKANFDETVEVRVSWLCLERVVSNG